MSFLGEISSRAAEYRHRLRAMDMFLVDGKRSDNGFLGVRRAGGDRPRANLVRVQIPPL
jgi:hypothetical protein